MKTKLTQEQIDGLDKVLKLIDELDLTPEQTYVWSMFRVNEEVSEANGWDAVDTTAAMFDEEDSILEPLGQAFTAMFEGV